MSQAPPPPPPPAGSDPRMPPPPAPPPRYYALGRTPRPPGAAPGVAYGPAPRWRSLLGITTGYLTTE